MCLYSRQEVVLLDNEIAFNEAIIEERDQGIQEIQEQIGEVSEIFKDLAVLVHDQGAMIGKSLSFFRCLDVHDKLRFTDYGVIVLSVDIDTNIENSHAATAQAKSQLSKAAKSQRSNSSLVGFV